MAAPIIFSAAASAVPWLSVLNLFSEGIGSYLEYQAMNRQFELDERKRIDDLKITERKFAHDKQRIKNEMKRFNLARKDSLNALFAKKMEYNINKQPVMQEKIKQLQRSHLPRFA